MLENIVEVNCPNDTHIMSLNIMSTYHFFKIHKINMDNGYMEAGMSTIPFIGELKYNYGYSSI